MKTITLLTFLMVFAFQANAQSVLFHEDFESPGYDTAVSSLDSLISSSQPNQNLYWTSDITLHSEGSYSVHRQVYPGNICYLTTLPFTTAGYTTVKLHFDQICKVNFLDLATIEVSPDGGYTWIQLTGIHYTGSAQFTGTFNCNSYGTLWEPSNPNEVPQNSWWQSESFDVSTLLADLPVVLVRFKLADGGLVGPANNYGWNIDNFWVEVNSQMSVTGVLTYNNQNNSPIAGAVVCLKQGNTVYAVDTTDAAGNYSFSSGPAGACHLSISSTQPWGGGDATDALLILKHFTGVQVLTGPNLLAADVNGDTDVNSVDGLMIMKRFVGLINTFPVGDWKFEPVFFDLPQLNPLILDVHGICNGDVNGSYILP